MPPKARNNKRSKHSITTANIDDFDEIRDVSVNSQDSLPPTKKIKSSTDGGVPTSEYRIIGYSEHAQ